MSTLKSVLTFIYISSQISVHRLRTTCERAKRTPPLLFFLLPKHPPPKSTLSTFTTSLTRARFEELFQDDFHSTPDLVEKILSDSKIDKSNVHENPNPSLCVSSYRRTCFRLFHLLGVQKEHQPQPWWSCRLWWWCRSPSRHPLRRYLWGIAIESAGGAMIALINCNTNFPIKILNFLHLLLQSTNG